MIAIKNRLALLFLTVLIFIIGLFYLLIQSGYYFENSDLFSLAITIDMVFFIPLFYFWLIRKQNISKITIIPVVILSYIIASFLIPSIDHVYLEKAKILLAPLELFAVCFIIYKVRLTSKQYKSFAIGENDFLNNVRNSLYKTLGENRISDLFTTEISIFYYGFFGWTSETETSNGKLFTYHKKCGYSAIVGLFFFLIIAETFSLHLVISLWSTIAAWILTVLSLYSLVFLLADYNASRKRPIIINEHNLQVRIAFRWIVTIPFENISNIVMGAETKNNDENYFRLVLLGSENVIIALKEPMKAKGFYGISKTFNRFGLSIDNKEEFYNLIREKINGK